MVMRPLAPTERQLPSVIPFLAPLRADRRSALSVVPPTACEAARRPNSSVTPGVNCADSS